MSRERIRILLGLETVGDRIFTDQRQQIIPDIKFTCDGLITKVQSGEKRKISIQNYNCGGKVMIYAIRLIVQSSTFHHKAQHTLMNMTISYPSQS